MSSTSADAQLTVAITADTSDFQNQINQATQGSTKLGTTLASALDSVVTKGKSVQSALDSIVQSISKMALTQAFQPLNSAFSGLTSGAFSGNLFGGSSAMQPYAHGGAFSGGVPIPFASGGVISSPVAFPLGGGQSGLAGEAGPEAIMPLTRGSNGKLGVGSGGSAPSPMNVTFHVTSPDPDSFARSQSQISAMLARAVGQGQRNM